MEKIVFQGVIHAPSQEGGPQRPQTFRDPVSTRLRFDLERHIRLDKTRAEGRVSRGHVATCHSKVTQPQRPSYCLEHYTHAHAQTGAHYMRNRKQTLCGDRTRWQENFYRVDDAPPVSKSFVTWMLTRDLFVVDDLIVLTTFYERIVNADMYISCVSSPKYNSVFCIWSTLWTNYFVLVIEILLKTAFFLNFVFQILFVRPFEHVIGLMLCEQQHLIIWMLENNWTKL